MREYYPGVADVHTLPFRRDARTVRRGEGRRVPILFPGITMTRSWSTRWWRDRMSRLRLADCKRLIERRVFEPLVPMEQAFREELAAEGTELERGASFAAYEIGMYAWTLCARLFSEKGARYASR